jgi:hypothetical protein
LRAAASTSYLKHAGRIAHIRDNRQPLEARDDLSQHPLPLSGRIGVLGREACHVAARPREARDEAAANGSPPTVKTKGISAVALLAATAVDVPQVTRTSTFAVTSSAVDGRARAYVPAVRGLAALAKLATELLPQRFGRLVNHGPT